MSDKLEQWFSTLSNQRLAQLLRKAGEIREGSWAVDLGDDGSKYGRYTKSNRQAADEACGGDPIAKVIACLLTAGYCEMWEFCDEVLGPESEAK